MEDTQRPFDDIRNLIRTMPGEDNAAGMAVREKIANFPGPQPILGLQQDSLEWLASWQKKENPSIERPLVAVFAGTHDVSKHLFGPNIIKKASHRVQGLTSGKSAIRGMAAGLGATYKIYEMGLEHPVPDMTEAETLSEIECAAAIAFGMEVVAEGADIIVLGAAGLGAATAAAAIAQGLYGGASDYWAGGQGEIAEARIAAVEKAMRTHTGISSDPLECLRVFGGRDIAGLVGAIIAARHQSIPVLLDGFIVCAAAAILHKIDPKALDHCWAGHLSAEPAHGALLDRLGKTPMLDFGLPVGDGTGATFALGTIASSVSALTSLV